MQGARSPFSSRLFLPLLVAVLGAGCAVVPPEEEASDPLEPVNRAIYQFNEQFDRYLLKPVAQGYQDYVPTPARKSVSNFYSNLGEPLTATNAVLQGKFEQGAGDSTRFIFNTTFGILGFFDVATPMGLPRHDEDFGQTFATWGIGEGWYLVLPFLGPSTVRDTAGMIPDGYLNPLYYVDDESWRYSLIALRVVDSRARLLGASRVRDTAALDGYMFTREAYRQHRWNRIHDGSPPPPSFDLD